jgi:hypothetical protein
MVSSVKKKMSQTVEEISRGFRFYIKSITVVGIVMIKHIPAS